MYVITCLIYMICISITYYYISTKCIYRKYINGYIKMDNKVYNL